MAEVPVKMEDEAAAGTSETMEDTSVNATSSLENGEENPKSDDTGKGKYTEEERLKRKAFFKQIREKRRLAREKYRQNYMKKIGGTPRSIGDDQTKDIIISFNMTEEDKKMLDYYKVRMSALKSENEQLHKRLNYLVRENMRFLQMGPTTPTAAFKA